jgi:hypothetical protein
VRDWAEDHAVGGLRGFETRFGKRRALRRQRLQPDLDLIEREFDLPFCGRRAQDMQRRRHDFRRDAVAVHDAETDRGGVLKGHERRCLLSLP